VPICKDDLIFLPKKLQQALGGMGPFVICHRVSNVLHLIDPTTLQVGDVSPAMYWKTPFRPLMEAAQTTDYIVLECEPLGPTRNKLVLADIQVARNSDLGRNDTSFITRTHIGHLLHSGDMVHGFDITTANTNDEAFSNHRGTVPDLVLAKKGYPEWYSRSRRRKWTLQRLAREMDEGNGRHANREQDEEMFRRDLEENPDLRSEVNLFVDPTYNADTASTTDEQNDEDFPQVQLDELMAGLTMDDVVVVPELEGDGESAADESGAEQQEQQSSDDQTYTLQASSADYEGDDNGSDAEGEAVPMT
jgi:nonsense-mediated mRNA decay protein 3